jgi:hypothetical protein
VRQHALVERARELHPVIDVELLINGHD